MSTAVRRPARWAVDGRRAVFLPVEVAVRELDSRLLMACALAEKGVTTILGQHDALFNAALASTGGVYVGKNMFLTHFPGAHADRYQELKARGFRCVYLDEEGAVFGGDHDRWRWMLDARLDPRILGDDDHVCAWGRFQADHYASRCPGLASRVHVTGHPRFDVYRPPYRALYEPAAAELRDRYGRFVLANTSFSFANTKYSISRLQRIYPRSRWSGLPAQWSAENQRLTHLVDALVLLAAERPDTTIVLRPHPAEDRELYRFLFADMPNVVVEDPSGPVVPWVLAAAVLVHDGCTTAIEAALAGTPTVTCDPIGARTGDVRPPNDFGDRRSTPEQVVEGVDLALAGRGVSAPPAATEMRTLLHNLQEPATPLLAGVIAPMAERPGPAVLGSSHARVRTDLARRRWDVEQQVRRVVRPLFPERHRRYRSTAGDFPGFDVPGTETKIHRIAAATGSHVRFQPMGRWLAAVTPGP